MLGLVEDTITNPSDTEPSQHGERMEVRVEQMQLNVTAPDIDLVSENNTVNIFIICCQPGVGSYQRLYFGK